MKTRAVRIHGKNDLRLDEFELPKNGDDEILAKIVSDSLCMSSYKAAIQGPAHKRVPDDVAENPTIIGHEFCGEIMAVGGEWKHKFSPGEKFAIQPALNYQGSLDAPGYSFKYIGGCATYVIIPNIIMELNNLLIYNGEAFFHGSLAEPMSCVIGAFNASYHTTAGSYEHKMGIKPGGNMAILAGTGPMGLAAIEYVINSDKKPGLIVVTDINEARLSHAAKFLPPESAAGRGVKLVFINASDPGTLLSYTDGKGFDDVFVFAPVSSLIELGDSIMGKDGCLNFFAGPVDPKFSANFNFYNVHYASTHIVATSGGNTNDIIEALNMMQTGKIDPAFMITHIGGLDSAAGATMDLPNIPGGKKLIYTHISMPLTAIADFAALGQTDPFFRHLAEIVGANNGVWNLEAEKYLLETSEMKPPK